MEKNNISHSYSDWSFKYNCYLVHVPSIGGKNSVDLQISIDLTEWCITRKEIQNIVLASNDRDFLPLCVKLKSLDKKIIIVAFQKINDTLRNVIDNFELIENSSVDLNIILHCFLLENKNTISIVHLKKLLKKINKKKKMQDYGNFVDNLKSKWNCIFKVCDNDIILNFPKLES